MWEPAHRAFSSHALAWQGGELAVLLFERRRLKSSNRLLEVRPVSPEGLDLYWRSYQINVLSAGYTDNQTFELKGRVEDFTDFVQKFRAERRGRINVQVVVSLYSTEGDFLGGFGVPLVSTNEGNFEMNLEWPSEEAERIANYKIWFAELRP